jgi:hypothetical protein
VQAIGSRVHSKAPAPAPAEEQGQEYSQQEKPGSSPGTPSSEPQKVEDEIGSQDEENEGEEEEDEENAKQGTCPPLSLFLLGSNRCLCLAGRVQSPPHHWLLRYVTAPNSRSARVCTQTKDVCDVW